MTYYDAQGNARPQPANIVIDGARWFPPFDNAQLATVGLYPRRDTPVPDGMVATGWMFAGIQDGKAVFEPTLVDAAEYAAQREAARQAAKSPELKAVENRFLTFCEQLTGQRVKAGFATLRGIIEGMAANPETTANALVIAAQLTAINDEGFREGGLNWWDDCVWHDDV